MSEVPNLSSINWNLWQQIVHWIISSVRENNKFRIFCVHQIAFCFCFDIQRSRTIWCAQQAKNLYFSCIELVIQRTIKLSYFGLIDARVSGSYKYLPVQQQQLISFEAMNYVFTITLQYKSSLATRKKLPSLIDHINGLTTLHFLYCKMNYCLFTPPTKKQLYFVFKIVMTYNEKKNLIYSNK